MGVQVIPYTGPRVETGAVQFGESDWPGAFIRGDRAGWLALILEQELDRNPDAFDFQRHEIKQLVSVLRGCIVK